MSRPIAVAQEIRASPAAVWAVISSPGHLSESHPFCAANPVHRWPGVGSHDTIEYFNGRIVNREFTEWHEGTGYELVVSDANGPAAVVSWRVAPSADGAQLSIELTPHTFEGVPRFLRRIPELVVVRPLLRRYLRSVLSGITWRVETGTKVGRNQFGRHIWFSR